MFGMFALVEFNSSLEIDIGKVLAQDLRKMFTTITAVFIFFIIIIVILILISITLKLICILCTVASCCPRHCRQKECTDSGNNTKRNIILLLQKNGKWQRKRAGVNLIQIGYYLLV